MALSDEKKDLIIGARSIGIPAKLIAELADVAESTVYVYSKSGNQALLQNTVDAMTALKEKKPDEWLKRFVHRQQFASVDRIKLDIAIDDIDFDQWDEDTSNEHTSIGEE